MFASEYCNEPTQQLEQSYIGSGNRCGHDPKNPAWHKFKQPAKKNKLPIIVQKLIDGIRSYYYAPYEVMPTLAGLSGSVNKDGKLRKPRTDGCEPTVLIMQAIFQFTEFASLRVGTPLPNGDFINRYCDEIAAVSGLVTDASTSDNIIPSQRFWRGWEKLKESGAFTVHKIYRTIEGEFETRADGSKAPKMRASCAIKTLNPDFLVATKLITYAQLNALRDFCSEKLTKLKQAFARKNPEEVDAKQALNRLKMRQVLGGSAKSAVNKINKTAPKHFAPPAHSAELKRQYGQELAAYAKQLSVEHPDKKPSWIREQARSKYNSFEVWVKGKV
ncbi:Putative plasmid replication protein repA [Moritella viscosa]|uniref:hypothetical protein n=1 Tax=Moritella viscosa TaxID=80854 RepID=UPI00091D28A3|nr:hypothetical protein [Moritella viscosa]SHO23801.1 Putative plasmid replication protein repA [Moritella viscosa]